MKKILIATLATTAATLSFAQNPLSVHVLNLENGLPSPNVEVTLETQKNGKWVLPTSTRDVDEWIAYQKRRVDKPKK
jgi:5-hydroxyisourate hydrolase